MKDISEMRSLLLESVGNAVSWVPLVGWACKSVAKMLEIGVQEREAKTWMLSHQPSL